MPYLQVRTNRTVEPSDKMEFMKAASARTAELLGKPESYVMVSLEDNQTMLFAGTDEPLCAARLASLGFPEGRSAEISEALSVLLERHLSVSPNRTYIEFVSPPRHLWGYNGGTFG
jgi:phenylpyruvate tautomerase PptA (4-oxalocrotonate tautomerase family)